jgi:hypothetical protein
MNTEALVFVGSNNAFRDLGSPAAEAAERAGVTQPRSGLHRGAFVEKSGLMHPIAAPTRPTVVVIAGPNGAGK